MVEAATADIHEWRSKNVARLSTIGFARRPARGIGLAGIIVFGCALAFAQAAPGAMAPSTGAAAPAAATSAATTSAATTSVATPPAAPAPTATGAPGSAAPQPLPLGYGKLQIGMSRDEVIAELKTDPLFAWRGPEDVSLLPTPNQSLIEVSGLSFIRRAFFQFDSGKLWVIILELADDRVDHYSIWTSLVAKYGQPTSLDPSASTWDDGKVRMSLERPLTLRYIDVAEFAKIKGEGAAKVSVEELDRRSFLGGL